MSEDEAKKAGHEESKDEVEGHRKGHLIAATDETDSDEADSDDDVEAHRNKMV